MDQSMTPFGIRRLQAALLIAGLALWGAKQAPAQPPADAPKLADYFGFQPLEIYRLERRIGNLMKSGVSSSFLPEKMNRHRITREKMNRHRITRGTGLCPKRRSDTGFREKTNRHRTSN